MVLIKKRILLYLWIGITIITTSFPGMASGEVKPITEAQEKLKGITEEEQKTLEKLFTLTQDIEEMEREEAGLDSEINELEAGIKDIEASIDREQTNYDNQLYLLEQVLVSYQRGGPASYLELLLKSESLSAFLERVNLIKDISKNVGELLDEIETIKLKLSQERELLVAKTLKLEQKLNEMQKAINEKQRLIDEQQSYLSSLAEEKEKYTEHLHSLEIMWADLKDIFSSIVDEFSRIIGEGYFTMEDLNLSFYLLSIEGHVSDDTFNRILKQYSVLPEIVFHFNTESIILEIPDKKLVLEGKFAISGKSSLLFQVDSGSFYGMPLEQASIDELFKEGPLVIDFEAVAGDLVLIEIHLDSVRAEKGLLKFKLKAEFSF